MKEPKTYILNMGAEGGFWGMPKEKIWDAVITLVSKEDYDALQAENADLLKQLKTLDDLLGRMDAFRYIKMEIENSRLREALIFRGYNPDSELKHHEEEAREMLKGEKS
jgi:hypothetical protein